ncbi:MAG: hypothetical protein K2O18_06405 [Oscillospiraceae bacterium]|nr:hypothetical protein [Oscillospiraceae bacterium]
MAEETNTGLPPEAEAELETAEKKAQEFDKLGLNAYIHKLRKPFSYHGKEYEELSFDFDKLTGKDFLAIGREMQALRLLMSDPSVNMDFQLRVATRACTEKLGPDALRLMPAFDFHCIIGAVRNFLLSADLYAMTLQKSRAGSRNKV